ncbi:hypothetical protein OG828_23270 [Streptomyces sp. NBC_00457]|nr:MULTISPECIES: hypothetical protein [unclassified Streptomyces]
MSNRTRSRHTAQRLGRTALFGVVRGVSTALGGAAVAAFVWWVQSR